MNNKPIRGDVWYVNLDPVIGHEQAKKRPCLVISADMYNKGGMKLAVILPFTSKFFPIPWNIEVLPPEGGINKVSYIQCNQIRNVSLNRFGESPIGRISEKTLDRVEEILTFLLDIDVYGQSLQ